jgi:putative Mg2+ transporter-C (MgtC) family protein
MIPETEIMIRLLVAAGLGALVGLERERSGQPAGLRTHIILVVGATLAMCLSINLAMQFRPDVPNGDPARLAAQVVSGIGFLGAGAILRYGTSIKGLTTATSLWTMAIVGLAVGSGYYLVSVAVTVLLLLALERRLIDNYTTFTIAISVEDRPGVVDDVKSTFSQPGRRLISISVERSVSHKRMKLELIAKVRGKQALEDVMAAISAIKGIRAYKVS